MIITIGSDKKITTTEASNINYDKNVCSFYIKK